MAVWRLSPVDNAGELNAIGAARPRRMAPRGILCGQHTDTAVEAFLR